MPKMKSNSSAKKRFKVCANGQVKRQQMGRRHILTKKSRARKRELKKGTYVSKTQEKTIKSII